MNDEKQAPPEVREKAQEILKRMESDPSFRQQVESDPEGVLTGAGLPIDAVGDFLRETGDVAGYGVCPRTRVFACLFTGA
ncbi:MAG: hypothetical protein M3R70_13190 [Actinomycetota bacterium]|nr:hypothetical protein [Actinomycetota bacterium]